VIESFVCSGNLFFVAVCSGKQQTPRISTIHGVEDSDIPKSVVGRKVSFVVEINKHLHLHKQTIVQIDNDKIVW